MKVRAVLQLLLFFICSSHIKAFTYSCNELKYHFIGTYFSEYLTYACVIPQEGYSNLDQLSRISLVADPSSTSYSFADIAATPGYCVEKPLQTDWKLIRDADLDIDCTQEFSLVMSSIPMNFITPLAQTHQHTIQGSGVVVVPQTGSAIRKTSCYGTGNIIVSTGAGTDGQEKKFEYRTWPCASVPDWIISFDSVFTIDAVDVTFTADYASDLSFNLMTHKTDRIAILSSGKSNDQQNMQGVENKATFELYDGDYETVTMNMDLNFDSSNHGSVVLKETHDASYVDYFNGTHSLAFTTNYFQVHYAPTELNPTEIVYSQDNIIIDIVVGEQGSTSKPTPTTIKPTTVQPLKTSTTDPIKTTTISQPKTSPTTIKVAQTTAQPHTSGTDAYCNCAVDKFGFPNGWNYNDIWLDIIVILDTSEAMGEEALDDAGALIESFLSDGFSDFLITDPTAPFYSRLGVISMSDTAEVLYNLNMTKADKVQGKASIKKGVKTINVVDAFDAALNMFNNGLKDQPNRAGTRQVIFYMTDSNPGANLNPLNQFKASNGVIIVDNFLEEGEIELTALKDLASDGYYSTNSNYMQGLQSFCKANCFCKGNKDVYQGSDPAIMASGGCYHASTAGVPFNKAKTTCANDGGIIAVVHNDDKGKYLQQLMTRSSSKSDYFWMGYEKSDEGEWIWEDQSNDPYTNWDVNEPSNAAVSKCAYVDMTTINLAWGAGNCQIGFPYVCEYTPCSVGYKNC